MTGALMQLVAFGAQDIYLTGNPMITYFKVVYRRHTNFAMESIEQTFESFPNFGEKVTTLVARAGDLISGAYIQTTLPNITITNNVSDHQRWTDNLGHYLIKEVSLDIGGHEIDKHYGDWLEIWAQLTVPASKLVGYREMIGQDPRNALGMSTGLQRDTTGASEIIGRTIYIPLQFWFCRSVGLALPLIALQYSEVKINVEFSSFADMFVNYNDTTASAGTTVEPRPLSQTAIWVDYIYLDTDERRRFAQISHEYLIDQVQFSGDYFVESGTLTKTLNLNFYHPVKELVWVSRFEAAVANRANQWSNYTNTPAFMSAVSSANILGTLSNLGGVNSTAGINGQNINILTNQTHLRPYRSRNPISTAKIKFNGHDRISTRTGEYFNRTQCRDNHTNIPESPGINVYSFAIFPEGHQPSGTCNFSRIDNAQLQLTFHPGLNTGSIEFEYSARIVKVYAVNYNVLRIMSGMGALAYME